jgi:hypothetical protein
MKFNSLLGNLAVLGVSLAVALLLCEGAARLVLNPADLLSVEIVHDDILGGAPSPSTRGNFDAWGFRNRAVPQTADIVAIGDSHTYGNTAKMVESWPYVLGSLSGRQIYNMGMGGYGPNQYFYLLQTKALSLKPKLILCGLYMGDDFENAYTITYGLDHWAYLRQMPARKADFNIWEAPPATPGLIKETRQWLSRHSVVYQLVVHASAIGQAQGEGQIKNAAHDDAVAVLSIPEKNILEAFRPKGMLARLDQQSPEVREGMRITFELLKQMNDLCLQNHVQFAVVVIPTKETVFSQYLEHNSKVALSGVIDRLLNNEREARAATFTFLGDSHITYVDPLPALRSSLEHQLYARSAGDMHPGKNGYRVIAQAAYAALSQAPVNQSAAQQGHSGAEQGTN